jgi:hypothetical protein
MILPMIPSIKGVCTWLISARPFCALLDAYVLDRRQLRSAMMKISSTSVTAATANTTSSSRRC